jgi:hypothetical protein
MHASFLCSSVITCFHRDVYASTAFVFTQSIFILEIRAFTMVDSELKSKDASETVVINGKTYRKRTPRLRIKDILAKGAPEDEGRVITMAEKVGFPLLLAIIFGISLLIFHHAPHEHATVNTLQYGFSMNNKDKINKKAMRKLMNEAKTREASFQTDLTIEPVYTVLETEEPFDINSPERNEL